VRTTLTIDPDVLAVARDLAKAQGQTIGQVVSNLARCGLTARQVEQATPQPDGLDQWLANQGITPFQGGTAVVTNQAVNELREELGI
jgi:hypothetical protein